MNKQTLSTFLLLFISAFSFAQKRELAARIDSLLAVKTDNPFNGTILITQNGQTKYLRYYGYANRDKKTPFKPNDGFVIGSISKQITAVLVLREYQKGHLKLDVPIHRYLPELKQKWADTITIHHLLTHTHGIPELDPKDCSYAKLSDTLKFRPGTQYDYSQVGYYLLSKILGKITGKTYAVLCGALFRECKMNGSSHPDEHKHFPLVQGYMTRANGAITAVPPTESMYYNHIAAGGLISTADDMTTWNNCLHNSKLLADSTYRLMITAKKNALRDHPLFGPTKYGYGITTDDRDNILQLGQTGFARGFVSMNFYFPVTKTSLVILENMVHDIDPPLTRSFKYQLQILKMLRESDLVRMDK